MHLGRAIWGMASLALIGACTGPASPVPVRGEIASLTGQWSGDYRSPASGRVGSIVFTLVAGEDTARGDVIMIPSDLRQTAGPAEGLPPGVAEANSFRSHLLTIEFVQVTAGQVYGRLDPYRDPECGCELTTTFTGTRTGDVLEGTYRSHHRESGKMVEGTWRVRRQQQASGSG